MAEVMYTFPQAFLILLIALQGSDYRLYEASNMLGASKVKQFFTVTLPSVKYGLISAMFVVFTLSFTDFGAPKIVGGQYNVLATAAIQASNWTAKYVHGRNCRNDFIDPSYFRICS